MNAASLCTIQDTIVGHNCAARWTTSRKKGYSATRLTDIVAVVRLSKSTFYGLFKNKEDCFLDAYEAAHYELAQAVTASTGGNLAERSPSLP